MSRPTPHQKRRGTMSRMLILLLHGGVLVLIGLAAVLLATWRGALWPFDLHFSATMAAGGLAQLVTAWGWVWLVPLVAAALLPSVGWRIALWPLALAGAILLHRMRGPAQGFMPLEALGLPAALALYALPVALALLLGSLLRETLRPRICTSTNSGQHHDSI